MENRAKPHDQASFQKPSSEKLDPTPRKSQINSKSSETALGLSNYSPMRCTWTSKKGKY